MEYRILVAHSARDENQGSDRDVKIITPSHTNLTFKVAKDYFEGSTNPPEYASAAVGTCTSLNNPDCQELFGEVPNGAGFVPTNKRVGKDISARKISALREASATLRQIGDWARSFGGKVILVACRGSPS